MVIKEGSLQLIGKMGEQRMTVLLLSDAIVCFKPRKTMILGKVSETDKHN